MQWWQWALIGFALMLSELAVPAFVLIWFGLGALAVAAAAAIGDFSVTRQILAWIIISLALVCVWFAVFRRGHHKSLVGRASAQIVGEVGMISESVAPFKNGRVRFQKPLLGSDNWECIADEEIEEGARVKVLRVEGSMLTVTRQGK